MRQPSDGGHCDIGESCYACRNYPGEICCTGFGAGDSAGYHTSVATTAISRTTSSTSLRTSISKTTTISQTTYTTASTSLRYYTTTYTYTFYSYFYSPLPTAISLRTTTVTETATLTVSASNLIAADGLFLKLQISITDKAESSASEQLATLSMPAFTATVAPTEGTHESGSVSATTFAAAASASATASGADSAWKLDAAVLWVKLFAVVAALHCA
ncbi:hypothetical protein B0A48_07301 [Cryoendolithus antarcticus]|uniref:Uncharacterized protein n=1 Tax=Cryoendolithus antarcticus TaxID=1507870 RepID=A0A1V8T8J5_9PEZI|nr:hypothetical protein B0A48_07301 [Cryoendolithus antarcticus]